MITAAEKKGVPFCDFIFEFAMLCDCFCIFIQIPLKFVHEGQIIVGLDKGLVPNRQQAIIWNNDGIVYWHIYASLGLDDSTWYLLTSEARKVI